jgi:hypothetical protein
LRKPYFEFRGKVCVREGIFFCKLINFADYHKVAASEFNMVGVVAICAVLNLK